MRGQRRRMLNIAGVDNRTHMADGFFTRVLRAVAELRCGLCVAIHDQHHDLDSYRTASAGRVDSQREDGNWKVCRFARL